MNCFNMCPFAHNYINEEFYRQEMPQAAKPADPYTYPENVPGALQLIKDAVDGEREDELFYDYLISAAPTQEAKEIITGIRNDERKHNTMFRKMYFDLTGKKLPTAQNVQFEKPKSYCEGVKKALKGELGAVQRYRRILFALRSRVHINMITEIITDEIRHANLYNLLYSMGQCFK